MSATFFIPHVAELERQEALKLLEAITEHKQDDNSLELVIGDNVITLPSSAMSPIEQCLSLLTVGDGFKINAINRLPSQLVTKEEAAKYLGIGLPLLNQGILIGLITANDAGLIPLSTINRYVSDLQLANYLSDGAPSQELAVYSVINADRACLTKEQLVQMCDALNCDVESLLSSALSISVLGKTIYPTRQFIISDDVKLTARFKEFLPRLRECFGNDDNALFDWLYTPCELNTEDYSVSVEEALDVSTDDLDERLESLIEIEAHNFHFPVYSFADESIAEEVLFSQLKTLEIS